MNRTRSLLFYIVMMVLFGAIIYWILQQGKTLENVSVYVGDRTAATPRSNFQLFADSFSVHIKHPLPTLLLQIIVIVLCTRFFGVLFSRIGQPAVIGEIVAGIVLGPSLLGLFFPSISNFIFPV